MPERLVPYDRMRDRVAVVTGAGCDDAAAGTGCAIATTMAREGARVCLVDVSPLRARRTMGRIESTGGEAFVCAADVTTEADCERAIAETVTRYGRVDTLVNNVGIASAPGSFENFDAANWDRVMNLNLRSVVLMCRAAVPRMAAQGSGCIVNISSIAGMRAFGSFDYGPSKAAMNQLTAELALACGRSGIRVNAVAPGHIATPLTSSQSAQARAARRKVGPLGIEGDAWDVAAAVLFLCSDEARFITAAVLPVDGGVTALGALAAHALLQEPD